jgi:hypothetical protein
VLNTPLERDYWLTHGCPGYVLYMWNAVMGWSRTEIQVYLAHLRRQVRDNKVHSWYRQRVAYGRKP